MLNANTIDPIFNAMLDKYTKLEKSPVRQSTTLSLDALKTSFAEIVNPGYGTPDSGQLVRKVMQQPKLSKRFCRLLTQCISVTLTSLSLSRLLLMTI